MRYKQVLTGPPNFKKIELIPVPTINGLALFCGFADRHSFYAYEKKKEFSHTIKRARAFIEREYEEILQTGTPTGAIFALKNFGWSDKQEIEHGLSDPLMDKYKDLNGAELVRRARDIIGTPTGNRKAEEDQSA